jgi:ligand-binding SRPBCC domain-containing protein
MPPFGDSGSFERMKVRVLERTQTVPRNQEETFRFFADPRNLKRLTPPFLQFKFLSTPPKAVQPGTAIDYEIRLYGVPVHWRTRIEVVEAPNWFVDVQEKGPYALWRHRHTFRDLGGGNTEIKDRVEYAMPFGPLGDVAYYVFVKKSLAQIFDYRTRELVAIMR